MTITRLGKRVTLGSIARALALLSMCATGCRLVDNPWLEGATESEDDSRGTTVEPSTGAIDPTTGFDSTTTGLESTDAGSTGPIVECGNGRLEEGEGCDATDFGAATCESLGQAPGSLSCTEGCAIDVTGCVPPGMVRIPDGLFEMGSDIDPDEQPIRQVQVDGFWMDESEVTVAAYTTCVDDGACSEPATYVDCNWMVAGRDGHPVNCVTWVQAEEYCGWAGEGTKRLPTEAEWEKAARSTDAREYPWGDSPAPSCTHVVMNDAAAGGDGCGMTSTWAVGSKPLGDSPYGAHDMAGNVAEWVADWYGSYDAAETDNPTGPAMDTLRVLRGSSWLTSGTNYFRAAYRNDFDPALGSVSVGFRCARTPPAAP